MMNDDKSVSGVSDVDDADMELYGCGGADDQDQNCSPRPRASNSSIWNNNDYGSSNNNNNNNNNNTNSVPLQRANSDDYNNSNFNTNNFHTSDRNNYNSNNNNNYNNMWSINSNNNNNPMDSPQQSRSSGRQSPFPQSQRPSSNSREWDDESDAQASTTNSPFRRPVGPLNMGNIMPFRSQSGIFFAQAPPSPASTDEVPVAVTSMPAPASRPPNPVAHVLERKTNRRVRVLVLQNDTSASRSGSITRKRRLSSSHGPQAEANPIESGYSSSGGGYGSGYNSGTDSVGPPRIMTSPQHFTCQSPGPPVPKRIFTQRHGSSSVCSSASSSGGEVSVIVDPRFARRSPVALQITSPRPNTPFWCQSPLPSPARSVRSVDTAVELARDTVVGFLPPSPARSPTFPVHNWSSPPPSLHSPLSAAEGVRARTPESDAGASVASVASVVRSRIRLLRVASNGSNVGGWSSDNMILTNDCNCNCGGISNSNSVANNPQIRRVNFHQP